MKSCQLVNSKIVKTLIDTLVGRRMMVIGTRIDMADGSWWLYARRPGTWTKHEPGLPERHRSGSVVRDTANKVVTTPERVTKYGKTSELHRTMKHCPALLHALGDGLALAV